MPVAAGIGQAVGSGAQGAAGIISALKQKGPNENPSTAADIAKVEKKIGELEKKKKLTSSQSATLSDLKAYRDSYLAGLKATQTQAEAAIAAIQSPASLTTSTATQPSTVSASGGTSWLLWIGLALGGLTLLLMFRK